MKLPVPQILAPTLAAALWAAALSGCVTTPEPVKEPGWEEGAQSAANAPPTAAARSAQSGEDVAHGVVTGALSAASSKPNAGGGPGVPDENSESSGHNGSGEHALSNAQAVEIIHFDTPEFSTEAPGPDAESSEVAAWISAARREGKSGRWIQRQLDDKKPARLTEHRLIWTSGDFDDDDRDDLGVAFFGDCSDPACSEGGGWTVGVVWGSGAWSKLDQARDHQPEFIGPADLTGDERPELIVSLTKCGAHTCYEDLQVYSAHRQQAFRPVLRLGGDAQAYGGAGLPQKVSIARPGDELPRLVVSGGIVGSAGAGPFQRTSRTVWGWNGDTKRIEQLNRQWETSNLRLHRLHDAVVSLEDDRLEEAVARLWQVIEDDELRELPEAMGTDDELARTMRAQLSQVARFLLARVALEQGRPDAVEEQLSELATAAPASPATRATRRMFAEWRRSKNSLRACQLAATVFPDAPGDDWLLDNQQLGYNAPIKFDASRDNGLCTGL